ncbi:hypothetical protein KFK09_018318 [Dendrobium nobile]|uniref:Reverse transcriptase RNase H-like domain-containing protein n=1 Tax=Dendrobium nobile TaxID=94219 RepID=A0A8T3AVF7_DENNO|nr:hypothetical protein KFK09_018318 [Dendrobium nobile]
MANMLAIQKLWPYLLRRHFIVRTNQRSLKNLLEKIMVNEEHQRWLFKLLGYDFEIPYRPRVENKATYGLSGCMREPQMIALSVSLVIGWEALRRERT